MHYPTVRTPALRLAPPMPRAQPTPVPRRARRTGLGRAGFVMGGLLLLVGHVAITAMAVLVATGNVSLSFIESLEDGAPRMPELKIDLSAIGVPTQPDRHIVYLNREGALLEAGTDDARQNTSSVVEAAGLDAYEVPAFRGSAARWDGIKKCVRERFAAYDIEIVDRRPVDGRYVMVMIGGEAEELQTAGHKDERLNGLGPLGDSAIHDAVAFVFSRTLRERSTDVCTTIAHEIGHAYGLDHTRECKDVMSYGKCGKKRFLDEEALCGERSDRECHDGTPTQNSHEELMRVLGPKEFDLVS